jgi:uncharacterized protein YjiS (DUF1127 family)
MRALLRALAHEIAGVWRHAKARDELSGIDDVTLRDLGLSRSELSSLHAELAGHAERTRRRTMGSADAGLAR